MASLYEQLMKDVRMQEGLNSCMSCGTCTAICPAASFYKYEPRSIAMKVQSQNEETLKDLLKSEEIWYCGECMSCKTRCPRGNAPGLIIMALRSLSQDLGYFMESEKGRQQLFLKRTIGQWLIDHGYCLYLKGIGTDLYPEQGPVWDWIQANYDKLFAKLGANYQKEGIGILRKIPESSINELKNIYQITGAMDRLEKIENLAQQFADKQNGEQDNNQEKYFHKIYEETDINHFRV